MVRWYMVLTACHGMSRQIKAQGAQLRGAPVGRQSAHVVGQVRLAILHGRAAHGMADWREAKWPDISFALL
jgi:hypothetical protein